MKLGMNFMPLERLAYHLSTFYNDIIHYGGRKRPICGAMYSCLL